jgi:transposase
MPKPYSQDLRDRVIDAVERGEMSRRAAARRGATRSANPWRSSGLNALNGMARESLSGTAATGRPS